MRPFFLQESLEVNQQGNTRDSWRSNTGCLLSNFVRMSRDNEPEFSLNPEMPGPREKLTLSRRALDEGPVRGSWARRNGLVCGSECGKMSSNIQQKRKRGN